MMNDLAARNGAWLAPIALLRCVFRCETTKAQVAFKDKLVSLTCGHLLDFGTVDDAMPRCLALETKRTPMSYKTSSSISRNSETPERIETHHTEAQHHSPSEAQEEPKIVTGR